MNRPATKLKLVAAAKVRRSNSRSAEDLVASRVLGEGWTVLRKGLPDLFCIKRSGDLTEIRFIEVKSGSGHLEDSQKETFQLLKNFGFSVEIEKVA